VITLQENFVIVKCVKEFNFGCCQIQFELNRVTWKKTACFISIFSQVIDLHVILFNDAFSTAWRGMVGWLQMMNWKRHGRKRL
jgi:hypothetical protein